MIGASEVFKAVSADKTAALRTALVAKSKRERPSANSPRVTLRLTTDEHAKLVELAHGITLSAYIRACLFEGDAAPHKRKKREPVADEKAVAELLGLLGQSRIANNLNQLAYAANTGSLLLDDETYAMITEAYDHVRFMRSRLIVALGLADQSSVRG